MVMFKHCSMCHQDVNIYLYTNTYTHTHSYQVLPTSTRQISSSVISNSLFFVVAVVLIFELVMKQNQPLVKPSECLNMNRSNNICCCCCFCSTNNWWPQTCVATLYSIYIYIQKIILYIYAVFVFSGFIFIGCCWYTFKSL